MNIGILFPLDKNLVFTGQNEDLAEKYVPVDEKTTFHRQQFTAVSENGKKNFPLARKSVFIS